MTSSGAQATVLIMAGGTGGHIYPALAVARRLIETGCHCEWLGTRAGLESDIVPAAGIAINYIKVSGLRGKSLLTLLLAPARVVLAVLQALAVLRKVRPDVVLGLGGFASGPGGVAAWLLRRPLLIHEQNAVAGLTNTLLSKLAAQVMQAFPDTFAGERILTTGNPVRTEVLAMIDPAQRFAGREGPLRVLVMGGSLGALILNETVPEALVRLPKSLRPQVFHQCGRNKEEQTRAAYQACGAEAEIAPFIDDVAKKYQWADLVICRSGALTVAELAAAGVASILVPFMHAVDDHQTANARWLSDHGAAVLIPQPELTAAALAQQIEAFARDAAADERRRLREMATAARNRAITNATQQVTEQCLRYARCSGSENGDRQ